MRTSPTYRTVPIVGTRSLQSTLLHPAINARELRQATSVLGSPWHVPEPTSENANSQMSPRTLDDFIAPGGISAVVNVIVIVIVDTTIDSSAISPRQNRNNSRGGTHGGLLNHDASGNGAPLVNEASRSRQTGNECCDKKNGFHGLSRC